MLCRISPLATALLLIVLGSASLAAPSGNLVANPGFEAPRASNGAPPNWYIYVPLGTAAVRVVEGAAHEGARSLVLQAETDIKAVAVSQPVAVAPGEKLRLSAWCRTQGLKSGQGGSLALSAGFLDGRKTYFAWHRARPAPGVDGEWSEVSTEAVVPAGAAYATLQIGLAMMSGKTWWDAAVMTTETPVAVRFAPLAQEYELGQRLLPVALLNRDPRLAGSRVRLAAEPGGAAVEHLLTTAEEEPLDVPFSFSRRGKTAVKASLVDAASGGPLFTASAQVNVPPLLATEPVLPTHFCTEDGTPQLEGRLWVHEEEQARQQLAVECSLLDAQGKVQARWQSGPLGANPVFYRLALRAGEQSGPEGVGDYTVRIRLHRGETTVAEATEDWHVIRRAQAEVKVGQDGWLIVDGKPFFPIGMFNGGRYPEQAAAGFNVTHHYWSMHTVPDRIAPNSGYKAFLDRTQAAGMKALVLVTHGGLKDRHLGPEVIRSVRMFRNHPALLAWDEEEGVARGEVPLSFLAELRDVLRREDPHHPLILGDTRAPIQQIVDRSDLFADQFMDLGMWWWYPFPVTPAVKEDALLGTQAARGLELVPPSFLTEARTKKPLWVGLQAYGKPERKDGRFPTPTEYRAQAYLALIHGAKGLLYYVGSGSRGTGILNQPEQGHWDYLQKLVSELRQLEPVILAPDASQRISVQPAGARVSVRVKQMADGRRVLLAVNRGEEPVEVAFAWTGLETRPTVLGPTSLGSTSAGSGPVSVLFEDRRVEAQAGRLADRFGPYEAHVYEFRAQRP